jgi:uncharacterized membrane protein
MADTSRRAKTSNSITSRRTPVPEPEPPYVPTWLPIGSLLIAIVGLGASIYLTYEHFTQNATLACSANSLVNCTAVTTSPQSKVFGIPVAVLGLVFFVGIIPLLLPVAWRMNTKLIRTSRIAAVAIGVCFVFYLIYVELFDVGKICEWCTGVHILTLALFAVVLFGTASLEPVSTTKPRR